MKPIGLSGYENGGRDEGWAGHIYGREPRARATDAAREKRAPGASAHLLDEQALDDLDEELVDVLRLRNARARVGRWGGARVRSSSALRVGARRCHANTRLQVVVQLRLVLRSRLGGELRRVRHRRGSLPPAFLALGDLCGLL